MTEFKTRLMTTLIILLVLGAATIACQINGGNTPQLNAAPAAQNAQTLRLEIPDAEWEPSFFKALESRIKQINLPNLREVQLPGNDLEARFWYDGRPDIINGFVIRRSGDQWSAVGIRQTGERHFSSVKQETLGTPKSGWNSTWNRFLDAGILTLPDESKVNCPTERFGGAFVMETNVNRTYRTYRYSSPQFAQCDEAKRIVSIEEIFADEFGLHTNKK